MASVNELRTRLNSRFGFREFTIWEWRLLVVIAVYQALDVFLTYYLLTNFTSLSEQNPVIRVLIERGFVWFWLVKFLAVLVLADRRLRKNVSVRKDALWMMVVIYTFVIGWNVAQVLIVLSIFT